MALLVLAGCGRGLSITSNFCDISLTGTPWTPNVSGTGSANHDSSVSLATTVTTTSGRITGYSQPLTSSQEITVSIDMSSDLGAFGSLTLQAEVSGVPSSVRGTPYPVLVYLSDGTNDYINLARAGSGGDCAQSGFYTCSGSSCSTNSNCKINWPSAYVDRTHWADHQFSAAGLSVNTMPTCNWTGGSGPPNSYPGCAFPNVIAPAGVQFFPAAPAPVRLRSGVTYTAKYALLSLNHSTLASSNPTATLTVRAIKKTDTTSTVGGAVDVNVVLVGTDTVNESRTTRGKLNLDLLMTGVHNLFSVASTNVKLGTINAIEMPCESGGDAYMSLDSGSIGDLFAAAGPSMPSATAGKAINLFLIHSFSDDASILGISGAIGGPVTHGTQASGVVVATLGKLDDYNPNCSSTSCAQTALQKAFVDLQGTVTHEMGHYLGLNHPSESDGSTHDGVLDTPACTALSSLGIITIGSCLITDTTVYPPTGFKCGHASACNPYNNTTGVYCPTRLECGFNHLMWYTSKNYTESTGTGDGNMLSTDSGILMNYCPLVQ